MKMTRKQFGLTLLAGLGAFFFGGWLGKGRGTLLIKDPGMRARYWRGGDHLAG